MCQIITLYTLNLYNVSSQLYLKTTGGKKARLLLQTWCTQKGDNSPAEHLIQACSRSGVSRRCHMSGSLITGAAQHLSAEGAVKLGHGRKC